MATQTTVVILGGGVGGLVAASRLRRALGDRVRVILVDRESHHLFQPSLLWLAVGQRTPEAIRRPLARLSRRGIEVLRAEVERIDPAGRTVTAGGRELGGDALIISLGAELAPEAVPGLAEAGHNLFTLAGATSLRDSLARFRGGRIALVTAAPAYKCPAAPYEAIMLIEDHLRRRGVDGSGAVQLDMYAAEPGPMGVAGPAVSAAVRGMVEAKGIRYHPEHQVTAVDPASRRLSFSNGVSADFDLLVYVPPHRVPPVLAAAGLTGASGWVETNRHTLETRHPGVYALGDATAIPLKLGKPLPKAGVFAHAQALVVAANLAAEWSGSTRRRSFDGVGQCFVETGGGRAGYGAGNFYAEPVPDVRLRAPSRRWHWGKVLYEWQWFRRWL
jgi:sulfide:quinone oxidoreductase